MRKSGIYTAVFAAFLMTTTAFAADVTPSVNAQSADSAIQAPVHKKDGHKKDGHKSVEKKKSVRKEVTTAPSQTQIKDVGYESALALFRSYYGDKVRIKSIGYEGKHRPYYEITGYTETAKKEMKVLAETGEIIAIKTKEIDGNADSRTLDLSKLIKPEVAVAGALKKAGDTFQVAEWEVEIEKDGHPYYEVKMIDDGGRDMKVTTEALTGKIVYAK